MVLKNTLKFQQIIILINILGTKGKLIHDW